MQDRVQDVPEICAIHFPINVKVEGIVVLQFFKWNFEEFKINEDEDFVVEILIC